MRLRGGSISAAGIRLFPCCRSSFARPGPAGNPAGRLSHQGEAQRGNRGLETEAGLSDRESIEWRIAQIQPSRDKTQAELNARLELSHIEDHYGTACASAPNGCAGRRPRNGGPRTGPRNSKRPATRTRPAARADPHRPASGGRGAASDGATDKPAKYSVVPYEGPFRTNRRPIYLECRKDTVVLQPEGIVFTETGFQGPMGPGNPLAAALRDGTRIPGQCRAGSDRKARALSAALGPAGRDRSLLPGPGRATLLGLAIRLRTGGRRLDSSTIPRRTPANGGRDAQPMAKARLRQQELIAAAPRNIAKTSLRSASSRAAAAWKWIPPRAWRKPVAAKIPIGASDAPAAAAAARPVAMELAEVELAAVAAAGPMVCGQRQRGAGQRVRWRDRRWDRRRRDR